MVRKRLPHKSLTQRSDSIYLRGVGKNTPLRLSPSRTWQRYADGNGLYILVQRSPHTGTIGRSWIFRASFQGTVIDLGLGPFPAVSLKTARTEVQRIRSLMVEGIDPRLERQRKRTAQPTVPTLRVITERCLDYYQDKWTPKHRQLWWNSLQPILDTKGFGDMRISEISRDDVIKAVEPEWLRIQAGHRKLQRLAKVFQWAKDRHLFEGNSPTDRVLEILKDKHPQQASENRKALPWQDAPTFIRKIHKQTHRSLAVRLMLEFVVLTGCRTKEARLAEWSEIDLRKKTWSIPRERLKTRKTFPWAEWRIPLSTRCLEILAEVKRLPNTTDLIFPGVTYQGSTRANSANAMLDLRKVMGYGNTLDIHGFRSTLNTWTQEYEHSKRNPGKGNGEHVFAEPVVQASLCHYDSPTSVKGAYGRSHFFEPRIPLMDQWAHYCVPQKKKKKR